MKWTDSPVRDEQTVAELFLSAVEAYGDAPAYRTAARTIAYRQVLADVSRCAAWLDGEGGHIAHLTEQDPYLFAVGFFAAMALGRCVALDMPSPDAPGWVQEALQQGGAMDLRDLPAPDPDACAVIVFSSGTTHGRKEVMLSQRNLATNTVAGLRRLRYESGMSFLHLVPFSHVFGLVCELLAAFHAGCCVCMGASRMTFFQDLKAFAPEYLNLPPAMAEGMLRLMDAFGAQAVTGGRLRRILCGGAALSPEIARRLAAYGVTALGCYGLSEAPGVCLNDEATNCPGTAGRPIDCDEIRIGAGGEILISGSNVMLGYRGRTDQPFEEHAGRRWLHTGDAGWLDEDGFLHVIGRMDHLMVFSDGRKIAPEQFEAHINALPQVERSRVQQGAGDTIRAQVMAKPGADTQALAQQVRLIAVEDHRVAEIAFVPDIPVTATGKVIRYERENP